MVIAQEPTQSLPALNRLRLAAGLRITREQQDVTLALVIPLDMIMFDEFVRRPPQRALAQEDHFGQALLLHRPNPALRIGIEVWTAGRQRQRFDLRALTNLGYKVCDQTIGNVLQRHGLPSAPERKRTTTWPAFIRTHLALLAGTDFFTAEVLTLRGLVTYYVLFFIHLDSRRVDIAGITIHPDELWMQQMARNVTMEGCGTLRDCRYLLHDRDRKYTQSFRAII